jgi:hypothetical protein
MRWFTVTALDDTWGTGTVSNVLSVTFDNVL